MRAFVILKKDRDGAAGSCVKRVVSLCMWHCVAVVVLCQAEQ